MTRAEGQQSLLEIEGLTIALRTRTADRVNAVEALDLVVRPGEIVCLVGESGSGKSMTAHAVLGLLPKRGVRVGSGSIRFRGRDVLMFDDKALRAMRARDVAMIFQEPLSALNPLIRIGGQIDEVFRLHTALDRQARRTEVLKLLAAVGLPEPERMARSYSFQLSGGQRQRAMIAMALALKPALLIADEPTTALDVTAQMQVLRLIKEIQQQQGTGVLFITHDFGVVAEIADQVVVMQNGRAVERGTPRDILVNPKHPYTRKLVAAIPGQVARPAGTAGTSQPLLQLSNVNIAYPIRGRRGGFVHAARDVTLDVHANETLGIVGESGSGKSTLVRSIVRLIQPQAGQIFFEGREITGLNAMEFRKLRPRIQMIFQDPYASLNPRRTIGQTIVEAPILFGVPREEAWRRCNEILRIVGLDASASDRYPHEFSGGQRQRIGIARALVLQPDVILADEPVSALDVSVQAQVLDLLEDVRRRFNLAMIFITHDMRVAAQICDRIAVMRRGEVVELGPTSDVFANPRHDYTKALLSAIPGRGLPYREPAADAQS